MDGIASIRILVFLSVTTSGALCQQPGTGAWPNAPSPQAPTQAQTLEELVNEAHLSVRAAGSAEQNSVLHSDFGGMRPGASIYGEGYESEAGSAPPATENPIEKYFHHPLRRQNVNDRPWLSDSLVGRATGAASSIVITRDEQGRARLNTHYLLAVFTSAVAHSAYRPYWRRSVSQPFTDFGSTIGNDAGMSVFHEFEPGIRQLVKSHEPRFVSKIEAHIKR